MNVQLELDGVLADVPEVELAGGTHPRDRMRQRDVRGGGAVEADDDILTQWYDASDLVARLHAAGDFQSLRAVIELAGEPSPDDGTEL